MVVECVYCKKIIKAAGLAEGISHGVCADCLPSALEELEIPLKDYLEAVPYPAMLVGDDGQVIAANKLYKDTINTSTNSAIDILDGGIVDESVEKSPPNGMYKGTDSVRMLVDRTLDTGEDQKPVPASAEISGMNGRKRMHLLVGTKRIGRKVIVELEDTTKIDVEDIDL